MHGLSGVATCGDGCANPLCDSTKHVRIMEDVMFTKTTIFSLFAILTVAMASLIAAQRTSTKDDTAGLHCWLYTGKYHRFPTVEEGCTTLPRNVVWEADKTTGYPNRITLRLRDGNFLPLVSQMDVKTAKELHRELGKMIALHESR